MKLLFLKRMLAAWNRSEREKINENWTDIERGFSAANTAINTAQETAEDGVTRAKNAQATADDAVETANNASFVANGIDGKATEALSKSNQAISASNTAKDTAQQAKDTAEYVQSQLDDVVVSGGNIEEVVQARDGFVNLRERLDNEKEQILENEKQINNVKQGSSKRRIPIVVFTFDDGYVEDLTVMKPLFDEFGYKATTYIIANRFGGKEYIYNLMDVEQIKELALGGWEIGAHTMNHVDLSTASREKAYEEIVKSKEVLEKNGFKIKNFAYPYGGNNAYVRSLIADHFRSAVLYNSPMTTNKLPLKKYGIERISMGSYFNASTPEYPETNTYEFYKTWIDKAVEENTLLVFGLHSAPMLANANQMDYLRQTLEYCRDNNIAVMTLDEALNYYDNKLDLKTYNDDYSISNDFIVDADSNLHAKNGIFTRKISATDITSATPPSVFPGSTLSVVDLHNNGFAKGFPLDSAKLYTDKVSVWADDVRQFLVEKWNNTILYRTAKKDGTWNEWKREGELSLATVAKYTAKTPPSDFNFGTTLIDVANTNIAHDFPFKACIVSVLKYGKWVDNIFQIAYEKFSNRIKYRSAKSDGSWGDWTDFGTFYNLITYKPITSDVILKTQSQMVFEIDANLGLDSYKGVFNASTTRPLPPGVTYYAWNDTFKIYLVLFNASNVDVTLTPANMIFNIKAV